MQLELTLIKSNGTYNPVSKLLRRTRYKINDDSDLMKCIMGFLNDNIEIINSAFENKLIPQRIKALQSLDTDELIGLKYMLQSVGLDILYWAVADNEVNPSVITDGTVEYNIVDREYGFTGMTRLNTKVSMPKHDMDITYLYTKISEAFHLFEGPLFENIVANPIQEDIDRIQAMNDIDETTGAMIVSRFPQTIAMHANMIIQYLGFDIYVITQ